MTIGNLEKKLTAMEKKRAKEELSRTGSWERIFQKLKQLADRNNGTDLDEGCSIAELCAVNIDWSNPLDFFRVLRIIVELRKEFGSKHTEHDNREAFRAKLLSRLLSRGESNPQNTRIPQYPPLENDIEVCNELSRHISMATVDDD